MLLLTAESARVRGYDFVVGVSSAGADVLKAQVEKASPDEVDVLFDCP